MWKFCCCIPLSIYSVQKKSCRCVVRVGGMCVWKTAVKSHFVLNLLIGHHGYEQGHTQTSGLLPLLIHYTRHRCGLFIFTSLLCCKYMIGGKVEIYK